jgi:serine/threonine-protein kinase RsbW
MQITFSLCLPRDEASVPVVRRVSRDALHQLGVAESCIDDIALALTEACTNVLDHAQSVDDEYEVTIEINDSRCEIRVMDRGAGFDHAQTGHSLSSDTAESGRGIFLMRAFMDELDFVSEPEVGTMVRLTKTLEMDENSPLKILSTRPSSGDGKRPTGKGADA